MGRKSLESSEDLMYETLPSIEELSSQIRLTSPVTGHPINCSVMKFDGEEILNKTNVHEKNQRIQKYFD